MSIERRTEGGRDLSGTTSSRRINSWRAVAAIATHMKFRPRSVVTLAPDKRAKYLAQLPTVTDAIAARALVNYHLERQRPMMGAFLDLLGIEHDNGLINDDKVVKPDAAKVKAAAKELATKFPAEDVSLYFATLVSQDPYTWEALADHESLILNP